MGNKIPGSTFEDVEGNQEKIDELMISVGIPRNIDKIKNKFLEYLEGGSGFQTVYDIIRDHYGV